MDSTPGPACAGVRDFVYNTNGIIRLHPQNKQYLALNGMKRCRQCDILLPVSIFSFDAIRPDGLYVRCKPCQGKYIKEKRNKKPGYNKENVKRYIAANPQKRAAHKAVAKARKAGLLEKLPCFVCGEIKTEAHHEDYTKPLEVMWLCRKHHVEHHTKQKRGQYERYS